MSTEKQLNRSDELREACELSRALIAEADYERAKGALEEWCGVVGDRPKDCDQLDDHSRAELLLRVGVLTAWVGSTGQQRGVLEKAKDLISEAGRIFFGHGLTEKVAETQMELGFIYWQSGEHNEARVTLQDALTRLSDEAPELKAVTLLRLATVEATSGRYNDAKNILMNAAPLFEAAATTKEGHALKGRFHNTLALVLRRLNESEERVDYIDRALVEYAAAAYHFEKAGSQRFLATVENNLGFLLSVAKKPVEALKHIEIARKLFTEINDEGRMAQTDDTRARVLLEFGERRLYEAERISRNAVARLERGDELALLAEALTTYGRILSRLGRFDWALEAFHRANDAALKAGNKEDAGLARLALIEELGERMNALELVKAYKSADELLQDSRDASLLRRLRKCAQMLAGAAIALSADRGNWEVIIQADRGCDLKQEVIRFEGGLIKRAWEVSEGALNKAARLLGMSHQNLHEILTHRHKDLLGSAFEKSRRKKSLIKHPPRQRKTEL